MSHHYSASQFNDSFTPPRLQNYSAFTNTPSPYGVHAQCLPNRLCPTRFIAHDNGHLYDCVETGGSSPWGDYSTWIWEQSFPCLCVDRLRHPEKYAHPRHIFIATEENCHEESGKKVADCINNNEVLSCMVERNQLGFGGGVPCCPKPCTNIPGIQMKVVVCQGEKDKKKVIDEVKRQQREWRRSVAGVRGKFKGKLPFSPGELRCVTWDPCCRGDKLFSKVYGCKK